MTRLGNTEFKRKFSITLYKNLEIKLGEMSFFKDFVNDKRGDLYPLISDKTESAEAVENNRYVLNGGEIKRFFCQFFPYATYSISGDVADGMAGFSFKILEAEATIKFGCGKLVYECADKTYEKELKGDFLTADQMIISCRPGAFDIYFKINDKPELFFSFDEPLFIDSNVDSNFTNGYAALYAQGRVSISTVRSYIDSGISLADIRPIRYENGDVMVESGRIYLTASIRMQAKMFQGVFSWVPGTAEIELTGAIFYDSGDGRWCGDVAASVLYHREKKLWYLWVCSFNHDHVLGHSEFSGDPRFGVNAIDIELMEKAPDGAHYAEFLGFSGDEDPDLYYDADKDKWMMAICRLDPETRKYRYVFFESDKPFEGYRYVGRGLPGAETGGSFVSVAGERMFVCGNDFNATSNYRIYSKSGMENARFDYPDGGFRGWGTLIPVKQGSRTRYFWLTFDRHNGSDYNWSYGNLYCFEGYLK